MDIIDPHSPAPPSTWRNVVGIGKDLLPFMAIFVTAVYGYGVKVSTTDRLQQQWQEDHVAIQLMRDKMAELGQQEAAVAAKVDFMISEFFKERRDAK